jgi:ribosome-associated heat shock protein Hsp15
VAVNDATVGKPRESVQVGDRVVITHRDVQRTVRVLMLGTRRGPASEARLLYEEAAAPVRLPRAAADWVPLLDDIDPGEPERYRAG